MTLEQIELACHALGLPNSKRQSYRNHFVAGPGHPDYESWAVMVKAGDAKRRGGGDLTGGDDLFRLTRQGAIAALKRGERLCPEDFPPIKI